MTQTIPISLLSSLQGGADIDSDPFLMRIRAHAIESLAPNAAKTDRIDMTRLSAQERGRGREQSTARSVGVASRTDPMFTFNPSCRDEALPAQHRHKL